MTTLAQDTFTRANQSGWGTASDGHVWSTTSGTTFSISGNEGQATGAAGDAFGLIGSGTAATVNLLVRISVGNLSDFGGVLCRYSTVGGTNGYRIGFYSGNIQCDKFVSGSRSSVGSASLTGYSINSYWWIRAVVSGSTLQARAWADGQSEPGAYQFTATDSSISAAGQYGLSTYAGTLVNFDSLTITDNSSAVLHRLISDGYGGVFS